MSDRQTPMLTQKNLLYNKSKFVGNKTLRKVSVVCYDPDLTVRLGTYNTAKEASRAYEHKRLEFQNLVAEKSQNASCLAATTIVSYQSHARVPNVFYDSESVVSHNSPAFVLEIDNLASEALN
ncbi:hypothetical protein RDABS01_038639 [Bienertia sinuspersici]